jgi:hypothetical protein
MSTFAKSMDLFVKAFVDSGVPEHNYTEEETERNRVLALEDRLTNLESKSLEEANIDFLVKFRTSKAAKVMMFMLAYTEHADGSCISFKDIHLGMNQFLDNYKNTKGTDFDEGALISSLESMGFKLVARGDKIVIEGVKYVDDDRVRTDYANLKREAMIKITTSN